VEIEAEKVKMSHYPTVFVFRFSNSRLIRPFIPPKSKENPKNNKNLRARGEPLIKIIFEAKRKRNTK
jgi:hypothetical protein